MPRRSRKAEPSGGASRTPVHTVLLRVVRGPFPGAVRATIARRARAMLVDLGLGPSELSLLLVDDESMQELNREHRGINRPTDVLAFPQAEGVPTPSALPTMLGDVVLCVPAAARQAHEQGHPLLDELTMLLGHGLLHLLGHDHRTRAETVAMRAETERLCAAARRRGAGKSSA